jgi:hypothetical protein
MQQAEHGGSVITQSERPAPRRARRRTGVVVEGAAVLAELARMVWQRRLWWMAPVLIAVLLVGAALFLLEATPVGPLIYPIF